MSGERLRYVLPGRSFSSPLGSPRVRLGRCFLPTSATDFRNEHPRTVRVPSAQREPCRPRVVPAETGIQPRRRATFDGGPTSGGHTIDVVSPTSAVSTTARLAHETSRAPRERGCLATVLSTACQAGDRPLTLSVAPRPGWDPAGSQSTEEPAPIPPPLRQWERHPRYRASSTDKCSQDLLSLDPSPDRPTTFARRVTLRSHVFSGGNPPPVSWLCHHDPGFRHFFAPCRSRVGGLDPKPHHELFTHGRRGPRAACRFLHPIRPASTTAQSSKPRPPRPWSPTTAAFFIPRT